MRKLAIAPLPLGMALFLAGCQTLPPGAEPGPDGTMAYTVLIEASEPGAKIEANGEILGDTPLNLKIFGDPDGTFHDFGSEVYVIRALPLTTNQYVQVRVFGTGKWFGPEDRIPQRIHFDMNQPPPQAPQYIPGAPVYIYPYGPPVYYDFYFGGPYYYGRPYYHGGYYHGGYYRGHYHGGGLQYYHSPSSGGARTR
jgi:hypothetical protein